MILYSEINQPLDHAVRIVLAEKALSAIDIRYMDPENPPENFNDFNPDNQIPILIDRDLILHQTPIIMEYLNERFPHPPLMPIDPVSRANNRLHRYLIERDIYGIVAGFENAGKDRRATICKKLRERLTTIAPIFEQKPYFMSDEYSLADCLLTPIMWRLPYYSVKLPPPAEPLLQFSRQMFARENFSKSLSDVERELPSP